MRLTDKELFAQTELGDVWWDASLPWVWAYLYHNKKLRVPPSWQNVIEDFHEELVAVPWF